MFKKIILGVLATLFAVSASADQRSEQILRRVSQNFENMNSYEVRFTVSGRGITRSSGNYFVSGDRYFIQVMGQQQFSDGVDRYEIYSSDREVSISKADSRSNNILINPTRAFEFAPQEFDSQWQEQQTFGGVLSDVVRLTPRSLRYGTGRITLYVSVETGLPVGAAYDNRGEDIIIDIDRIVPLESIDQTMFQFDSSRYRGYEIIDFR